MGPDGWLYVTSLPGGPEDPSLGAHGSVFKVHPYNGKVVQVATGFAGATGLAVSRKSGTIYVAELFGGEGSTGQISVVRPRSDTPVPLVTVSSPAAIELRDSNLYVTTDAVVPDAEGNPQAIGKVTKIPLKGYGHRGPYGGGDDLTSFSEADEARTSGECCSVGVVHEQGKCFGGVVQWVWFHGLGWHYRVALVEFR